jgi:hypothetical protein
MLSNLDEPWDDENLWVFAGCFVARHTGETNLFDTPFDKGAD